MVGFVMGMQYGDQNKSNDKMIQNVDMSDWVTYQNDELGFSVMHPDYILPTISDYGETIVFYDEDKNKDNKVSLSFSVNELKGRTLEEISFDNSDPMLGEIISDTKKIKLGNTEGYTYTTEVGSASRAGYFVIYFFVPKDSNEFVHIASTKDRARGEELNSIENKILSTFKVKK